MPSESAPRSQHSDYWRMMLLGEDSGLNRLSKLFRAMPRAPRCKLCQAPFQGPVAPLFKLLGFRPWALNRQMCRYCVSDLDKHQGGAEVPVSLLFAEVRGSTTLAEQMSPAEHTSSLQEFFSVASKQSAVKAGSSTTSSVTE